MNNKKLSKGIHSGNDNEKKVNYLNTLINKASEAFSEANYDNALKYYNEAILIDQENHVLYSNKSAILLKLGKAKEAIEEADYAINLQPSWPKAYFRKSEALKSIGNYIEAIIVLCNGLQIDPDCDEMLQILIQTALLYPDLSKTFINILEEIKKLNLETSSFVVISVIGQELLSLNYIPESIHILTIAISIDIESIKLKESVYGALAKAYYRIKKYSKACEFMEIQINLNEILGDSKILIELLKKYSQLCFKNSYYDKAFDSINKAIVLQKEIGISWKDSFIILADIYTKLEYWEKLENIAGDMLAENDEESEIYWILGKMFININEWEKAEDCFCYGIQFMKGIIENVLCECYILKCRVMKFLSTYQLPLIFKDKLKEIEDKIYSIDDVEVCEIFNILFEISYHLKEIKLCKIYVRLQLKFALEYQWKSKYYLIIGLGNLSKFYLLVNDISAAVKINQKRIEIILGDERDYIDNNGKVSNNCELVLNNIVKLEVFSSTESVMKYFENMKGSEERFELLIKILSISKSENQINWIIKYLTKLIKFCKRYNKYDKVYQYTNDLKGLVNIHTKYEWILLKMEGFIFVEDKQYENAIKKYEECLMIIQENENVRDEIKLCIKLALVYEKSNEYEECLVYLEQGLIICKQYKNIKKMIFLYNKIGKINQALRRYLEAAEAIKRYLTLAEIFHLENELIEGYIMLSEIYISLKEYNIALNVLIEAKKKIDNDNNKKEKAIIYGLLGKVYQLLDKKKNAISCFCKQMGYLNYVNNYEDMLKCLGFLIFEKKECGDIEWCVKLILMRKQLAKKIGTINEINVLKDDSKILNEIGKFYQAKEWLEEAILNSLKINYDFDSIVEMIIEIVEIFDLIDENEKALELLNTITKIEAFSNSTPVMIMKAELTNDINDKRKIYSKIIDNGFWDENIIWKMIQLYWFDNNENWIDEYSYMLSSDNISIIHVLKLLKELQKNYNNISNNLFIKIENILNTELCEEATNLLCEGFLYLNIYAYNNNNNKIKFKGWNEIYFELINQNWKTLESLIISLKNESNSCILESVIVNTLSKDQINLPSSFEMISNTINQIYLWKAIKKQFKCHDKKEPMDNLNKYFIKKKKYNYYNSGLWNIDGEWFREMLVIWKILQQYKKKDFNKIKLIGLCEICQKNIKLQDWDDIVKMIESRIDELENFTYLFKTSFLNIIFIKKLKNKEIEIYIEMNKKKVEIISQNGTPIFYVNILFNYLNDEINNGQVLKWDKGYGDCSTFINYPIKGNIKNYTKILIDSYDYFENKNISIIWLGNLNKVGFSLNEPKKNIDIVKKLVNNCCDLYIDNNIIDINIIDNLQYLDILLIKTDKVIPKTFIEKSNRTIIFDNDVDEKDILQFYNTKILTPNLINKVYIYGDIIKENCHYQMAINLTEKFVSISNNMDEVIKLLKQTTIEPRLKLKELINSFDLPNKYKRKSRRKGKDRGSKILYSARNSYSFDDDNIEKGIKNYCSEGEERKSALSNTFSQISITLSEKDLDEIQGESGAKIMSIDMEFDGNFSFYDSSKNMIEMI